jgi:hypothetical protein
LGQGQPRHRDFFRLQQALISEAARYVIELFYPCCGFCYESARSRRYASGPARDLEFGSARRQPPIVQPVLDLNIAREAPLGSRLLAFLLGVAVARRR